ncbi:MAG: T9SS type B sorting domain-containing protein, partial [Flavobacterium sp.]|nr:T9SS type B sorting domain-containing protein [Flavobacterium sp.]
NYVWSNGNTTNNFINTSTAGNYFVTATNANNCSVTKNFFVQPSESAIINSIDVNDFNDNLNTITVNFSGIGSYELSLDGINFQSSNIFTNVSIGEYVVTVRDINGCLDTVSNKIFVLDFPKFFTPNNDGFNDLWTITNLNKAATINIYDRFGKFLYLMNASNNSWNGTLNDQQLPADDYWFTLQLDNNRIIKNHFSLKR